jgi:hypothetical protein
MADLPEADDQGADAQDIAEVFDEDNLDSDRMRLARDDEELNFDDMPDVYDATSAEGDKDDDDAIIGDDLSDDEIVELSVQDEDESEDEDDDDAYRAAENLDDNDDAGTSEEVSLSYAGDLNTVAGAHSAAQRYESKTLSDQDLEELGYKTAPDEPRTFETKQARDPEAQAQADHEDEQLDSGLEETFPASDPVSVKHIT